jgi:hypothetical protein
MNTANKHFYFNPSDMEISLETTLHIAASDPHKIKVYPSLLSFSPPPPPLPLSSPSLLSILPTLSFCSPFLQTLLMYFRYRKMRIGRISMGVQTTDFKQAKVIGCDDANASTDYLFRSVENILTTLLLDH